MAHLQQLNWSYFKPEFSGKPEEDVEEHLLRTNDWMETHNFPDDQKVRRFCLTLKREARLWYETLGTAQLDWKTLRDCIFNNSIPNLVVQENNTSMLGDHFNLMKMLTLLIHIYIKLSK